jgi:heme-degrading monooxygenase HmoA
MAATIRTDDGLTTLINIFTVEPENQKELIEALSDGTEAFITAMKGWVSTNFLTSKDGRRVIVYSQWRSPQDVEAMRQNPHMGPYLKRIAALAKFEAATCDVVYAHHA